MAGYLLGQLLSAMAALAFEIILTRVFSLSQWYHFAFMAISVALLGYGVSGTLLTVSERCRRIPLPWLAAGQSLSIVAGYLAANTIPFDSYRIAWEPLQLLYMAIYYLSLSVPFIFAGLITARLLSRSELPAGPTYGANLLGSGLGPLFSLAVLPVLAGAGSIIGVAALASAAAVAFSLAEHRSPVRKLTQWACLGLLSGVLCCLALSPPAGWAIRLSPYKSLSQAELRPAAQIVYQSWNAFSRVDVLQAGGIRSVPGMSLSYTKVPAGQMGLFIDGDNLSPVQSIIDEESLDFLDHTPEALLFRLRPGANVLIFEPAAGQSVLAARAGGADQIVALLSNPLIMDAVNSVTTRGTNPYADSSVEVIVGGSRTPARRFGPAFDVVQLPLTDSYRPIRSGAFSLSENYQLTVEALRDRLNLLAPDGILAITRWLQLPPTESLRAGALVIEALSAAGVREPANHIIAIRSWSTCLIMAKREPFTPSEVEIVREFCRQRQFDLVTYPGMTQAEANQYNQLAEPAYYLAWQELLTTTDRRQFYREQPFDVAPPTDNRPFFFHFFKWQQTPEILRTLGTTWQPFGGSGYFVLVALLVLTLVIGVGLILLPLALARRSILVAGHRARTFLVFALLGLAFMAVEIPLLQQFILFLDQPTYAFAVVLFAVLAFSGLGSLLSDRVPAGLALGGAFVTALLLAVGAPILIHELLDQPIWLRGIVTILAVAPAGFVMGMPFPRILTALKQKNAGMVPWAWAINGTVSVVGSVLATMLALSWGFQAVLLAGALAYAGVAVAAWPIIGGYRSTTPRT